MRAATGTRVPPWALIIGLALLPIADRVAGASEPGSGLAAARATRPRVTCEAAVQHPIHVRVEALDPVRRGATVRLRLTAGSRVALSRLEAKVVSPGSGSLAGPASASLGRLAAGREASAEFAVAMPARGERALVQFRVEGEGAAGRIGRGATFNLLPDGPSTPDRVVAGASGQLVAEHRARRRP